MVRYQSNQSIRHQIEQKQLLSTKSSSLRTGTVLRNKRETTLKTDMKQQNANIKTKLRQKRKLLVYKKMENFILIIQQYML